jgi:hypothetical protein
VNENYGKQHQQRNRSNRPHQNKHVFNGFAKARLNHVLLRVGQGTLVLFGLGQAVVTFWGPFWPTEPEIHPREAMNGSSFRLPFTIKNTSIIPILNAEMTCGIDWVYFGDRRGNSANFVQIAFVNDTLSIAGGQTVNYECDASHLVQVNQDGSWTLRGVAGPGNLLLLYPPLEFRKMCLWIRGDYKIANWVPWSFTSAIFQWPSAPGVYQWTEGPLHSAGQITQDEWLPQRGRLPPDVVRCNDEPHKVALLFDKDGTPHLAVGPDGKISDPMKR